MLSLTASTLLFTIAAVGISEVSYLIKKRRAAEAPVCPIGGRCAEVLNSKYSRIFGIHNDLLGLAFYFASAFILGFLVINENHAWQGVLISLLVSMLAAATVMSVLFTYLQARVIKAWCFWCVMSALTVFLMDMIFVINYFAYSG